MSKHDYCILDGCTKTVYARGLCHLDYTMALRLIASGKTTWQWLEDKGRSLPVKWDRYARRKTMLKR